MAPGLMNPLDLTGRSVLVTGASSGIGRETAIMLSELGARVILSGRDETRLAETLSQLHGSGHISEVFDLENNLDGIPAWIKAVTARTGPLNGLVHSAGIQMLMVLQTTSAAKVDQILRTNVTSAIMLVKGFRAKGCSVPGGSVVLLASAAGVVGRAGISAYSASKAAVIGFTRSAAVELARENLRVNCVAPGYVTSAMAERLRQNLTEEQFDALCKEHPLGIGSPRDVAGAIAFLLADTGKWITGSTLVVDGGFSA